MEEAHALSHALLFPPVLCRKNSSSYAYIGSQSMMKIFVSLHSVFFLQFFKNFLSVLELRCNRGFDKNKP